MAISILSKNIGFGFYVPTNLLRGYLLFVLFKYLRERCYAKLLKASYIFYADT